MRKKKDVSGVHYKGVVFNVQLLLRIWQNMMHFSSRTLLSTWWSPVISETTLVSVRRTSDGTSCHRSDCLLTGLISWKILEEQQSHTNFWDWGKSTLASFLLRLLSYFNCWEGETSSLKCFLRLIVNMTLCSLLYLLLSLLQRRSITVQFLLIATVRLLYRNNGPAEDVAEPVCS